MPGSNPFAAELSRRQGASGNPFSAELDRRRGGEVAPDGRSSFDVFSSTAANRWINNLLALPQGAGKVLAGGAAVVEGVAGKVSGEPLDIRGRYERQKQQFPASALIAVPAPTVQDVAAGMRSAPSLVPGGESPTEAFARHRGAIAEEETATRAAHPVATAAGDVAGDVATLATGRVPLSRMRARDALVPSAPKPVRDPGVRKYLDETADRLGAQFGAGVRRTAESGLEGAVLAAMQNNDPLVTAGVTAGLQAGGSVMAGMLAESTRILPGRPLTSAAIAAAAAASFFQFAKELTPGGRDRWLESEESGHKKVAAAVALGLLSRVAGYGGTSGRLAENLPALVDTIQTIPRGAIASFVADMTTAEERGDDTLALVTNKLSEDPEFFGEAAGRRLQQAIVSEGSSFADEVGQLMRRRRFADQVDDLREAKP